MYSLWDNLVADVDVKKPSKQSKLCQTIYMFRPLLSEFECLVETVKKRDMEKIVVPDHFF